MKWSTAQSQAIAARNRNLVVSAGAGSGKTAVLVERVVALLEDDATLHVPHFLIMTFTEAAAGEMRQRIARRLEACAREAFEASNMAQAERFFREADSLWQAQISTIHSFCLDVIRQNILRLDIAPDFRLQGENERKIQLLDAAEAVIEAALAGADKDAVQAMMTALRLADSRKLTQVLLRLYNLARSQVQPHAWLERVAAAYPHAPANFGETPFAQPFRLWVTEQLDMADKYFGLALQIADPIPELGKYSDWLRDAIKRVDILKAAFAQSEIDMDTAAMTLWLSRSTATTRYKGPEADQVKALREAGNKGMKAIAPVLARGTKSLLADLAALSPHITTLCQLTQRLLDTVSERKQAAGELDFTDLEHFAYRVLTDANNGEMARLQQHYRHVFVDEYQDTSPIQDALVDCMTTDRDDLFAVGDVKQSIYRFRMAEPGLFLRRYEAYRQRQGGDAIDLTENYRSRKEIVGFINFAFGQLFRQETTDFAYDDHARMQSGAIYPELDAAKALVEVHLLDRSTTDGGDSEADAASEPSGAADTDDDVDVTSLEREARIVAQRILQMQGDKQVQIWDKHLERNRPLALGDIAILLRSGKDALNTVLGVLRDNGIAASASTTTGFYDALEVQWLVAALGVIDNPRDDLALITLLRSPLIGWDEDLLATVRLASRRAMWDAVQRVSRHRADVWTSGSVTSDGVTLDVAEMAVAAGGIDPAADASDAMWTDPQVVEAARAFRECLAEWRQFSRQAGVADTLQHVLDATQCLRYFAGMARGSARHANVQQLLALAQAFDARTGHTGLYEFLQQWQREADADLDIGTAAIPAPDAVQVMTIHRSKGLEYPVVFVMDLGKQFRFTQDFVYLNRDYGIGAVAYDTATQQRWRTVASIGVAHAERRATLAEEARIFYVALTRARERLILVGSAKNLPKRVETAVYAHDMTAQSLLTGAFMRAASYMDWLLPILLRHPQARSLQQVVDAQMWDRQVWYAPDASLQVSLYTADDVSAPGRLAEAGAGAGGSEPEEASQSEEASPLGRASFTAEESPVAAAPGQSALIPPEPVDWYKALQEAAAHASPLLPSIRILNHDSQASDALFGKVSATDMRRLHVALMSDGRMAPAPASSYRHQGAAASLLEDPDFVRSDKVTPREEGIAFHAFMQRFQIPIAPTPAAVREELARLVAAEQLSEETAAAINVDHVCAFLQSPLGVRMQQGLRVFREQPFFHRIDVPIEVDGVSGDGRGETVPVVAQGVIDCLVEEADGWLVIDYKTDHVAPAAVGTHAREYEAQVATYLEALRPLTQTKPVRAYLYFVRANVDVPVQPMSLPSVFVALLRRLEQ